MHISIQLLACLVSSQHEILAQLSPADSYLYPLQFHWSAHAPHLSKTPLAVCICSQPHTSELNGKIDIYSYMYVCVYMYTVGALNMHRSSSVSKLTITVHLFEWKLHSRTPHRPMVLEPKPGQSHYWCTGRKEFSRPPHCSYFRKCMLYCSVFAT